MYNVRTLNKIAPIGLDLLDKANYAISDEMDAPDAVILRSFAMHDMELPASLKAIARAGAGVNNIPIEKCSEKGIVVFNTPGANANAVKELAIAGLLISSRKIIQGVEWARTLNDQGDQVPKLVEKGKSNYTGPELLGKKLGVIGLGAIGVMVANTAITLGMEVEGFDPYISIDAAWGLSRSVKKAVDYRSLIESCDYITLHVPLTSETKGMINAEAFSQMKNGIRILNFSRGELVNDEDMKKAIDDGVVSTYVTDFPNEGLLNIENVIAIPHLGASTPESEDNCAIMASSQLKDFLENGNIINSVNYPSCELVRSSDHRVTIAHKNVPNMIGQISTVLAQSKINILNLINKSKASYAYTMIDAETEISSDVIAKIQKIEGVLKVSVL